MCFNSFCLNKVMLYHCLTLRYPFEGESLPMLMYNICHTNPPELVAHRPELPPAFCQVVMAALSKDRTKRPASALDFLQRLEPFLQSNLSAVSAVGLPEVTSQPSITTAIPLVVWRRCSSPPSARVSL